MSDLKNVIMPSGNVFDSGDWETYSQEYRKKPVVIKALRLQCRVVIKTLEGEMVGEAGDWLIEGVNGEFYPCKNDIFNKSYERAK